MAPPLGAGTFGEPVDGLAQGGGPQGPGEVGDLGGEVLGRCHLRPRGHHETPSSASSPKAAS